MTDYTIIVPVGVSSANNNPDNYAAATETYVSKDYETEVAGDVRGGQDVCTSTWGATDGYSGSGGWRHIALPEVLEHEDNAGIDLLGTTIPDADAAPIYVISYMFYMAELMSDDIVAATDGFWNHGNKIIDLFMYNAAGTFEDTNTRQTIFCKADSGEIKLAHVNGGGGVVFFGGAENTFRFEDHADEWIWFSHVFDSTNEMVNSYYKLSTDSGVTRTLRRVEGDVPEDEYQWNSRGFWGTQETLWGYWDDIGGAALPYDADRYLKVDRVRVANGWINPPF